MRVRRNFLGAHRDEFPLHSLFLFSFLFRASFATRTPDDCYTVTPLSHSTDTYRASQIEDPSGEDRSTIDVRRVSLTLHCNFD